MTLDERVAILEAKVEVLTLSSRELALLLREHTIREEETTREVLSGIATLNKRMAHWYGIAAGVGVTVSAGWALLGLYIAILL